MASDSLWVTVCQDIGAMCKVILFFYFFPSFSSKCKNFISYTHSCNTWNISSFSIRERKLKKTVLWKTVLSETGYRNIFNNNFIRVWRVLKSKSFVEQNYWGLPGNLLYNLFLPEKKVHIAFYVRKMFYLAWRFILVLKIYLHWISKFFSL